MEKIPTPSGDQELDRVERDTEPRYRALFHNRTVAIARCQIISDELGHPINYVVEEVNEAYERIVGIKKAHIEGRLVTDVFPGIERFQFDFIGNLGRLGLYGGEMDFEVQLPGTGQWLSIHAYGSGASECTAIFTDVTAQKKAEAVSRRQQAQLQAIIDNSPVLISMKDPHGNVILANRALLDMVGAEKPEQFVGRSVFDLFPPEVAQQLWANDLAALEGNAPQRAEEMVQDKDGRWRTYLTMKFPVRDSFTGESYGVCAISTDITDQKRAEGEPQGEALPPGSVSSGPEKARNGQIRVLVVDDNNMCLQVASQMLAILGLQCDASHDGQEALDALAGQTYDLILMDCEMSIMDGLETTRRIRAAEARGAHRTTIVACTASVMKGDLEKCLAAGMDDFISKPVQMEEIVRIVGKWLT